MYKVHSIYPGTGKERIFQPPLSLLIHIPELWARPNKHLPEFFPTTCTLSRSSGSSVMVVFPFSTRPCSAPVRGATHARLLATLLTWNGGAKPPSPNTPIPHSAWLCLSLAFHSLQRPSKMPRPPAGCIANVGILAFEVRPLAITLRMNAETARRATRWATRAIKAHRGAFSSFGYHHPPSTTCVTAVFFFFSGLSGEYLVLPIPGSDVRPEVDDEESAPTPSTYSTMQHRRDFLIAQIPSWAKPDLGVRCYPSRETISSRLTF